MVTPSRKRGFTLIELLVVIAIIGVLSSVILSSLNVARAKARDAKRQADLHSIQTALELYYSDNGVYPDGGGAWRSQCVGGQGWTGSLAANTVIPGLTPNYISQFPTDPAMNGPANLNCYMYYSNKISYKVLDWNLQDSPNPNGAKTLLDPRRNATSPGTCTGPADTTISWAIWSDESYRCY